ncbi:MAG: hypothetical protein ACREIQ_08535 [Nitrospiria bacterium]
MSEIKDGFGRLWSREDVLAGVGRGWRMLVGRLIDDLFSMGWDGQLIQIKEKFGGLRFYVSAATEEISKRIEQAAEESEHTCETCGEEGKISSWDGFWMLTLCPEHGEGRRNWIIQERIRLSSTDE